MDLLKASSIDTNTIWRAAAKPRHGPIFEKRPSARLLYRKKIRENQNLTKTHYSNNFHDALLKKDGRKFWNCWNSKLASHFKNDKVDGCVDAEIIVEKFADNFSKCYVANNAHEAYCLSENYTLPRKNYIGLPAKCNNTCGAELGEDIIYALCRGKAAGLDNVNAEHLLNSYPIISTLLAKLYNLMLLCHHVPTGFGLSYTLCQFPRLKTLAPKR